MPMLHNEKFTPGEWCAEAYTRVRSAGVEHYNSRTGERLPNPIEYPARFRWKKYNRPHHHIHPSARYELDFLAKNLKEAAKDDPKPLRMRNLVTGDIIMADIL